MPPSTTRPDGEQVRRMIASLSPDAIARLIPQETLRELLRTQNLSERNQEPIAAANQPTRAVSRKKKVNGFMAFRSYYASIFQDRPQKDRSPLVTTLWQTDPFRSRWAMMASVFSHIRDFAGTNKGRMVMSGFLRVACPLMGIPKPGDYLRCLNWEIIPNDTPASDSHPDFTLRQDSVPPVGDQARVPMTELELLRACVLGGFPFENSSQLLRQMEDSSVTIMTRTAPPSMDEAAPRIGINQQYITNFINDPVNAVATLLPPNEDTSSLLVDINIIPNFRSQQMAPPHHHSTASPTAEALLTNNNIPTDSSRMVSFPAPAPTERRDSAYDYSSQGLGLW